MNTEWEWDEDFKLPFYTQTTLLETTIVIPVYDLEAYEYAKSHIGILFGHKRGHNVVIRKMYNDEES